MSLSLVVGVVLVLLLAARFGETECSRCPVSSSFESDPVAAGWHIGARPGQESDAAWIDSVSESGSHSIVARVGWWASPRFVVEPDQYCRVCFASMVEGKAYWMVEYYDAEGRPLPADHYSSVDPSRDWQTHTFCFRGRKGAVEAELRFEAMAVPLFVDRVHVEPISHAEAARWADAVYAAMPPVDVSDMPAPHPALARTRSKLRQGPSLRIVLVGDSIMNDMGNSAFDVLLERARPAACVEVIPSTRGGTGCVYYKEPGRVKQYALDHQPDLLIIGGISNGWDTESIRSVIRQVRAGSDPDILLLSGAVSPPPDFATMFGELPERERRRKTGQAKTYRPRLANMAHEEGAAYLDMRARWDRYEQRIRRHPMWLRRDVVHANARGRQVLARILAAYLAAEEPSE